MTFQVNVVQLDGGMFTASGRCEECGVLVSSGGTSAFAADSGTRMLWRRHNAEAHPVDVVDADDGLVGLDAG